MKGRTLMWFGVAALFVLSLIGLWHIYGVNSITLTESQIQERINKQLDKDIPVKGKAHLIIKTVKLQSATVHIQDGRVTTLVDVEGVLRNDKKFTLTAYTIGVPVYTSGEFYFKPEKIEVQKFAYEGSTPTEVFNRFAKRYLSDDKARQFIEDKAPKVEEWMTATAENAAIRALEKRAVYRPKDDVKGLLLKASLESVKIDQDKLVVTFSLWQLTITVLIGIVLLVVVLVFAWLLVQNPTVGAMFILFG